VTLTATARNDGTSLSYDWNIGSGTVSGGLTETYTWNSKGIYTVTFTATDECDSADSVSTTVTVESHKMYIYLPLVMRNY
jgi:PKD repeat protein